MLRDIRRLNVVHASHWTLAILLLVVSISVSAKPTLLHNARIYTVSEKTPQAEAMVFDHGVILSLGTESAMTSEYPDAERINAGGMAVYPGFIDAHAHLMGLGLSLLNARLEGTGSVAEVVSRVRAHAARVPEDAWITGRGWDQNDWDRKNFPSRYDLDQVFEDQPVWLRRIDGHAAWANSRAIELAGIDADTADPDGGRIVRDESGEPTGIFIDNAMGLVQAHVPPPSAAQMHQALDLALKETARFGLTGVHEAGTPWAVWQLYLQRVDEERFPLRLYAMADGDNESLKRLCKEGLVLDYRQRLTMRSVKFYLDGALGSRGAALIEPYSDDPANSGLLFHQPEVFQGMVRRAMECELQVNTHAIGTLGNRVLVDSYAAAIKAAESHPGRHRMEHAQVVLLEDVAKAKRLGLIASMQPTHATSDMPWAQDRLGQTRIKGAYAWRSFISAGVPLALGSDFPVEAVNPLLGFYAAITRQDAAGEPAKGWLPEQRLTRAEALRGFTLGAAYAAFQEQRLGSLEAGKRADFVILSKDIMRIDPKEILTTRVMATYLDGELIYQASE